MQLENDKDWKRARASAWQTYCICESNNLVKSILSIGNKKSSLWGRSVAVTVKKQHGRVALSCTWLSTHACVCVLVVKRRCPQRCCCGGVNGFLKFLFAFCQHLYECVMLLPDMNIQSHTHIHRRTAKTTCLPNQKQRSAQAENAGKSNMFAAAAVAALPPSARKM